MTFDSHGSTLVGAFRTAPGSGPRPTAVLLHGLPGGPLDTFLGLPDAIAASGWHSLSFHYRGSWNSRGAFSLPNALEDVEAAIEFVVSEACRARFETDPGRTALIGHSFGGSLALMVGANHPAVGQVGSLAGGNGALIGRRPEPREAFRRFIDAISGSGGPLRGTDGDGVVRDLRSNLTQFDVLTHADALARKRVLLVYGRYDPMSGTEHHAPLAESLRERDPSSLTYAVLESDHEFSDRRDVLAQTVTDWLRGRVREP